MRLVVVSAAQCQLRPRHIHSFVQSSHSRLKAAYTAPLFGAHTDPFAKYLREPALAHAHRPSALGHSKGFVPEKMDSIADQLRTVCTLMEKLGQEPFEGPELLKWRRDLAQPLCQTCANPHIVQCNGALEKQIGTLAK